MFSKIGYGIDTCLRLYCKFI